MVSYFYDITGFTVERWPSVTCDHSKRTCDSALLSRGGGGEAFIGPLNGNLGFVRLLKIDKMYFKQLIQ